MASDWDDSEFEYDEDDDLDDFDDDDEDDEDDEVEHACIECGGEIGVDVGPGRDTPDGPICEECDE